MNGIIIINKQKGCTSNYVVNQVKHILNCKVGHTGTLDPNATGVLPLLLGDGTKAERWKILMGIFMVALGIIFAETTSLTKSNSIAFGLETSDEFSFLDEILVNEGQRIQNEKNRNEAFNNLGIDLEDDGEVISIVKTDIDGSQEKSTFLKYADCHLNLG